MAALVTGLFAAWPGSLLGEAADLGGFSLGLIWLPPNTNPGTYYRLGDRPWYPEYHWHGAELVTGNLYVLTGLAAFLLLIALALVLASGHDPPARAEYGQARRGGEQHRGCHDNLTGPGQRRPAPAPGGSHGLPGMRARVPAVSLASTSQSSLDAG